MKSIEAEIEAEIEACARMLAAADPPVVEAASRLNAAQERACSKIYPTDPLTWLRLYLQIDATYLAAFPRIFR
jgi:hypothetical protein